MPAIPDNIPEPDQTLIQDLLEQKPPEFTDLTLTQHEAFENGVLSEGSHLVIAETGNGKTFLAEAVTKKALKNGDNVAYLVPSVSLVGEKHEAISAWASEDTMVNARNGYTEANVIVATFESFFEAVIRGYADRFGTVVLDDFHEIYSDKRGPNIEKGISAAINQDKEILGISATIGNPHTIARWMNADLTISSESRAVPISERPIEKTNADYATQIAKQIRDNINKGPFLVFNDTRANAEARARGVAEKLSFDVPDGVNFREDVKESVSTTLTDAHKQLIRLLKSGVAYHHAGLESGLKDLIEAYTEDRVIKCVFCTTTLSYGFDSPVQSVIVADLKRWGDRREFIGVYEYVQWIGRAGRDEDMYDEAFAFPMYNNEDAVERFQFDKEVEEKNLEDITSHLSGQQALRWLVLELVDFGWDTNIEVLNFVESTLFWSETVNQIPQHVQDDFSIQPGDDVRSEIRDTLTWVSRHGLIHKPIGQPQQEEIRYESTDLGAALVEYEHSNWFDNSVEDVLELAEWLQEQGGEITPEKLVKRFAEEYYHCDQGLLIEDGEGQFSKKLELHDLSGSEGITAALACWYWCAGISLPQIEGMLNVDDLTELPKTSKNLSIAVESVQVLYAPIEMPDEPDWLGIFADQLEYGVPGPDMYLIETVDHLGRVLYNNLASQLNRSGANTEWDIGDEHYVIERLSSLYSHTGNERLFIDTIQTTSGIGETISQNLSDAVKGWEPEDADNEIVPFGETIHGRQENNLVKSHDTSEESENNSGSEGPRDIQPTTLDDF